MISEISTSSPATDGVSAEWLHELYEARHDEIDSLSQNEALERLKDRAEEIEQRIKQMTERPTLNRLRSSRRMFISLWIPQVSITKGLDLRAATHVLGSDEIRTGRDADRHQFELDSHRAFVEAARAVLHAGRGENKVE